MGMEEEERLDLQADAEYYQDEANKAQAEADTYQKRANDCAGQTREDLLRVADSYIAFVNIHQKRADHCRATLNAMGVEGPCMQCGTVVGVEIRGLLSGIRIPLCMPCAIRSNQSLQREIDKGAEF